MLDSPPRGINLPHLTINIDDSLEKFCVYEAYNEACKAAVEIIMGLLVKHSEFPISSYMADGGLGAEEDSGFCVRHGFTVELQEENLKLERISHYVESGTDWPASTIEDCDTNIKLPRNVVVIAGDGLACLSVFI